MKTKRSVTRIWLLSLGIAAFAAVIVFRLYIVQIVNGEEFVAKADRQYFRSQPSIFDRGSVFFKSREGNSIPAAVQKTSFALSINPSAISNYQNVYQALSSVIEPDYDSFKEKFEKGGVHQEIVNRLSIPQAEEVRGLNLKGVSVYEEKWRYYPGDSMASHALGFVAYQTNELGGRYGLERFYEDVLKRKNDPVYANFFTEVFSGIRSSVSTKSSEATEGDVLTTIEPSVQSFVESELAKLNENRRSEYSGAIVIDPSNGDIVAMAVYPDFNPNNFRDEENISVFSNPLVESVYEMGSIMKALTLAAGLDSGAIRKGTVYFDAGTIFLDGYQISNFDGKSRGLVDMQSVLNNSLNTGAAFVVSQMGNANFAQYMFDFGLGEKSDIDLPNEAAPLVGNLKSRRDLEYATASFGQGVAVTPISMTRALSALANDGVVVTPHLMEKIIYQDGTVKNYSASKSRRVLKSETAEEITRMLVQTVDEALLQGDAKIPNYSVAAKTGTAQIARSDARGYYDDRFFHTFFGYFPAFDPKFLVFMFTYNPQGVRYASETLTYPFMDIAKFLINYYEIPPDR